jgi:calcium-binding protein CML
MFNHFDGNGDGKISQAELRQCVEAMGVNLSANEVEAELTFLDRDGDGLLGFDDFMRLMERWNEEDTANDLKEAFEMYAMDKNFAFKVSRFCLSLSIVLMLIIRKMLR